jgi:hypothetical protein
MNRVVAACLMMTLGATSLFGQTGDRPNPPQDLRAGTSNRGNITSTGQTVPIPGASQSQGTTSLDLGIQRKDNEIPSSVCKGC